jgi:uncharacterized damage-inducible protein DinB
MKNYFIRLFNYDTHANRQMNTLIAAFGDMEKPRGWMAHLLAAQQIWLLRCKGLPAPGGPLWPDNSTREMESIITVNDADWLSYIATLQPEDLDRVVSYKTLKGVNFENTLGDILAHVINHGTHHRAQIGQHLKQAGATLPVTDYILYVRETYKTTS